ncbi:MAG: glycoside hydrolase family 15 protein [Candidatus Thermoplasmatota archaeon]|jgi:glucoamylase|nr:glycoside hydrolase family 15 protein [Candidatus Thermoplasmatota archaeon]
MDRGDRFPMEIQSSGKYPKISHHGMIASNRTAALVSTGGTIDWACLPTFQDNPLFDSLLDASKGGYFSIRPYETSGITSSQAYMEDTNVLVTTFRRGETELFRLTDFIPASEYEKIDFPEIHRRIDAHSPVEVFFALKPNFNFGKSIPQVQKIDGGFLFAADSGTITLSTDIPGEIDGGLITGSARLQRGESRWLIIQHGTTVVNPVGDCKSDLRLRETLDYWKSWVKQGDFPKVYRDMVVRTALTLKGLFYQPTGLMVAAPTSSLPECIGGERNWDYRYAWVRDTSYVVEALSEAGYRREAIRFLYDIMEIVKKSGSLKTLYPITGDDQPDEYEVDYEGYMKSRPVRMGNLARDQLQIDEFGSIINAVYHVALIGGTISSYMWHFVIGIVDSIGNIWRNPDSSIWEFRTEPRHYVYSKVMAWIGIDRGIKLGKLLGYSAPYEKWQTTADAIKQEVISKGFSSELGSFVQYYGATETDGSLLRIPLTGILDPSDPMCVGTVRRIEKDLMSKNYLFRRYNNYDGLNCQDNPFTLLSFWYAECLMAMGEKERAREVFESLLKMGNHLGLFSEEIDLSTMEMIGNFPQALTHIGIMRVAYRVRNS